MCNYLEQIILIIFFKGTINQFSISLEMNGYFWLQHIFWLTSTCINRHYNFSNTKENWELYDKNPPFKVSSHNSRLQPKLRKILKGRNIMLWLVLMDNWNWISKKEQPSIKNIKWEFHCIWKLISCRYILCRGLVVKYQTILQSAIYIPWAQ